MNKLYIGLIITLLTAVPALAQECGPSCPVCSGAGSNSGALLLQNSVMFSSLLMPSSDEETTVMNVRYGILNWFDVGLGYAVETEKMLWNARVQPLLEKENSWRPGIIVGTGSVQTGGSDQSIYSQLIKTFKINQNYSFNFSIGAATLLPDADEVFALAGFTANVFERYSAFVNYDGESFHEGVSWIPTEWLALSFLMVETELPAFAITFKF